jgi:replication factor C subunit 1
MADKRAVLISGPPGIGKTTSAHLVADIEGWEAIEFNASDTRSKKSIENLVTELTTNHVMGEYFSLTKLKKKQVIIMDEVDGMSAGDRGGNAQLIQLIKKTKVPIICICNDRMSPKVRSLANYCYDMRFRRPTADQIETRMKKICSR